MKIVNLFSRERYKKGQTITISNARTRQLVRYRVMNGIMRPNGESNEYQLVETGHLRLVG